MSDANLPVKADEKKVKEIVSTPNHIQILEYEVEGFGGVRPDMKLIFSLDGKPIVGWEADQGRCKSSLLSGLIFSMGGPEAANSFNVSIDEETKKRKLTRDIRLTFKDFRNPDITYEVRVTNTSFKVKHITKGADNKMTSGTVDAPKDFLNRMFGPVGLNPVDFSTKKGKDQITLLRQLYSFTPEDLKEEQNITISYKEKYAKRTLINNELKRLDGEIKSTGFHIWDPENKCFIESEKSKQAKVSIEKGIKSDAELNTAKDKAQLRLNDKTRFEEALDTLNKDKAKCVSDIESLKAQLEAKEKELLALEDRITKGKDTLKGYETAKTELDTAWDNVQAQGTLKLLQKSLTDADAAVKKYQDQEDAKININAVLDNLKIEKKKFISRFTPQIEGIEIIVSDDSIDEAPQLPEGIYFKGRSMQELSESELWDFFMQLCHSLNIRFIFIENIQILGSNAVERINEFVKNNYGKVFYTAMDRNQKELQFTMHGQLC